MSARPLALAALALAAAFGSGAPARAQTPPQDLPSVISPLRVETDPNNVNLVNGRTTIEPPVLSVPGAPNLRFDRVQNAAPYVAGRRVTGDQLVSTYSVHIGAATSESFNCFELVCENDITGSGSRLSPNGTNFRQAGTGAHWSFTLLHVSMPQSGHTFVQYYASSVAYPSGETISYSYDDEVVNIPGMGNRTFYRPIRITSNLGYHITLTYQSDDFESLQWGKVAQATIYRTASPTDPETYPDIALRRLTYSGNTITDSGSTIDDTSDDRAYACTGCVNALGFDIEVTAGSSQLPTEATPALQVAAVPGKTLVQSVTVDGVPWTYSYSYQGGQPSFHAPSNSYWYDRLTVTGPNGYNQVYTFTILGQRMRLATAIDSINRTTSYQTDAYYRPILATYPEGNQVGVAYDALGNVISRTAIPKPGSVGLLPITETAFFPVATCTTPGLPRVLCHRPLWTRDGMGRQTDYVYNDRGQLTERIDPADASGVRRYTCISYETAPGGLSRPALVIVRGDALPCALPGGFRTEYQYTGNGLLVSLERRLDPGGGPAIETAYTYDDAGRLLGVDGPLAGTDDAAYYRYDAFGRRTWEIGARAPSGLRIATRTTYRGSDDKVLSTETGTIPNESSTDLTVFRRSDIAYDDHRNPVREAVSSGGMTYTVLQRTFDDRGRIECEARRMNPAIFAALPASACTAGTPGTGVNDFGPDRISRNVYDAAGQRLQVRIGAGSEEGAAATWAYNLNGQITTMIDGNGNRAELRYDGHGRQDRWTFPSAALPPDNFDDTDQDTALASSGAVIPGDYEAYTYDAAGNRLSHRKRDGSTLTLQYDNLNRLIVKIVPERPTGPQALSPAQTRDVYYSYDIRNLQLSARFDSPTGEGVTMTYDGFGRLASSSTNMHGPTERTLTYQYDPAGNRTRITHPDGAYFTQSYDALSRPVYLSGNSAFGISYIGYYSHGLPTGMSRPNGAQTVFFYDPVQRNSGVVQEMAGTTWDSVALFDRNPASQLTQVTRDNDIYAWTGHYALNRPYTINGLNQYSNVNGTGFAYDANGNLTSDGGNAFTYDIENRLVGRSGGVVLSYDPLGRLFQVASTAGPTTQFLYDGDALVAEYVSDAITRRYVHGRGADVPMVQFTGSGFTQPAYLHADERGSIVATSDASNYGTVNRYDEYGIPAPTNSGRFQYTGQIWIPELGMYHYKARVYSPTLGRFLQVDPIGYEDQFNLYAYVGNDPVNGIDPTGTSGWNVSRPTYGGLLTPDHMFTVVAPSLGGPIQARFSYSPDWEWSLGGTLGGNLVSITGTRTPGDIDDAEAWAALKDPVAARAMGIRAVPIDASDDAIISAGRAVDQVTGRLGTPGQIAYAALPSGISPSNVANSNTASYAIAQLAGQMEHGPNYQQALPPGRSPTGWGQYRNITDRIRSNRIRTDPRREPR